VPAWIPFVPLHGNLVCLGMDTLCASACISCDIVDFQRDFCNNLSKNDIDDFAHSHVLFDYFFFS
jgi:hypothetical protein